MNPFLVLDVTPDCSDEDVRAAYHRLLREFPPEKFPSEFQQIHEAATALRTERDRWHCHLLHQPASVQSPLEALEAFARLPGRARPPGFPAFKSLLRACAGAARKTRP
jgi:curved DNA-binding protein CbpA